MKKLKGFNLSILISTFFYIGFFPYASGTAGSILAFVLYMLLLRFLNPFYYISLCLIVFVSGVYFSSKTEKIYGLKDPPFVVIDEVLGYLATMSAVLWIHFAFLKSLAYAFCGLVLFRFFDILKPFPVGYLDKKVSGGLGIMLDDLAAAIYSIIVLLFIIILAAGIPLYL